MEMGKPGRSSIEALPAGSEKGRKSNGRNFPSGFFPGYELYLDQDALLRLASLFNSGCKDVLNGWHRPLKDL